MLRRDLFSLTAAAGLTDRGSLAEGQRADAVLIAPGDSPRVVAVVAQGRLAFSTAEGIDRLS